MNFKYYIFLTFNIVFGVYCIVDYCEVEPDRHFLCKNEFKSSSTCEGPATFFPQSETDSDDYVRVLNQFRLNVTLGIQILEGFDLPMPPAADMRELVLDKECEEAAMNMVKIYCSYFPHRTLKKFSNIFNRFEAGLFFYGMWLEPTENYMNIAKFLQNHVLFEEQEEFQDIKNISDISNNLNKPKVCFGKQSNLLRSEFSLVGCAMVIAKKKPDDDAGQTNHNIVCVLGGIAKYNKPVYTIGENCSLCLEGSHCSEEYPGLCISECTSNICYSQSLLREDMSEEFFERFALVKKDLQADQEIVPLTEIFEGENLTNTDQLNILSRKYYSIYLGPKKGNLFSNLEATPANLTLVSTPYSNTMNESSSSQTQRDIKPIVSTTLSHSTIKSSASSTQRDIKPIVSTTLSHSTIGSSASSMQREITSLASTTFYHSTIESSALTIGSLEPTLYLVLFVCCICSR